MLNIFHWLPRRNLSSVALVCRRWHRLILDESLWTRVDVSSRNLPAGALGQLMSRQVLILKLSQSEVRNPPHISALLLLFFSSDSTSSDRTGRKSALPGFHVPPHVPRPEHGDGFARKPRHDIPQVPQAEEAKSGARAGGRKRFFRALAE